MSELSQRPQCAIDTDCQKIKIWIYVHADPCFKTIWLWVPWNKISNWTNIDITNFDIFILYLYKFLNFECWVRASQSFLFWVSGTNFLENNIFFFSLMARVQSGVDDGCSSVLQSTECLVMGLHCVQWVWLWLYRVWLGTWAGRGQVITRSFRWTKDHPVLAAAAVAPASVCLLSSRLWILGQS